MTGHFQLTFDDLYETYRSLQKDTPKSSGGLVWLLMKIAPWVLIGAFTALILAAVKDIRGVGAGNGPRAPFPPPWVKYGVVPVALAFTVLVITQLFRTARLRRSALKEAFGLQPSRTINADNDGITFNEPTCEIRAQWAHYSKFEETPHNFLLFMSNKTTEIVPKRAFVDEGSVQKFRNLLERHISEQTREFEVVRADRIVEVPLANDRGEPQ